MSPAHVHLMLNHLPLIGGAVAILLLALAIYRRSDDVAKASFGLFALFGIVSVVVFLTGEGAEEIVEKLPGFSESITEAHEEIALFATIAMAGLGALAMAALGVFRGRPLPRWVTTAGLVASLAAGSLMGYTAFLGGQIRHTEIRGGIASASEAETESDEPDEDGDRRGRR